MTSAPDAAASEREQPRLPVVPLRDNVVFPHQLAPLAAGRPRSVAGLQAAVNADARVILAVQRQAEPDDVGFDDLHPVAVVATVGALRLIPGAGAHALVEGQHRIRLLSFEADGEQWSASYEPLEDAAATGTESDALAGSVRELYADYVTAGGQVSPEVAAAMARATDPARVADIASAAPDLTVAERVELLQSLDVVARLRRLAPLLGRQVEVASMRTRIHEDVQRTINKSQREHILREQLRAVRKELAELDGEGDDSEDLVARIEALDMPPEVKTRALKEVSRLEQIPGASPEMGMVRTWVDWLLDLPWGERPTEHIDIDRAAAILDEDHYGLAKVKDRILEWMAVRDRAQRRAAALAAAEPDAAGESSDAVTVAVPAPPAGDPMVEATTRPSRVLQTPILCLVGPPGVGKTSLGRSIARAMERRFVRLSLGGIRDEAEIRGHRRTYIGALPGRIIQSMKQAGTVNPVIMLDEIDKVGTDFRGDPSAALLEVLDPEQNREFSDHYLEVPYDLSNVLFITTANMVDTISPALRDRMELIRISGYTEAEKLGIAEAHLLPRQLEQHGLQDGELTISHGTLVAILHGYTREAGVRQLDRTIAEIARKVPRRLAAGVESVVVEPEQLSEFLGPQRFDYGEAQDDDEVGAVTGVVVSEVGGDIVTVEALAVEATTRPVADRAAGQRDGGVGPRGALVGARARRGIRRASGLLREPRPAHPRACRGHPQGRPVGRRHHGHRHGQRGLGTTGAPRRCHDGRGDSAGSRAPHRRGEGQAARRAPLGADHVHPASEEHARPRGDPSRGVGPGRGGAGRQRRRGTRPRPRRRAGSATRADHRVHAPAAHRRGPAPHDHGLMVEGVHDLVELTVVVDPTYNQNCYLLHRRDSDAALVVDPGLQHGHALQLLEDNGWRCDRVLLTHGHGDHVNGVPAVVAAHHCPVALHPADREQLVSMRFLPGIPADTPDVSIDEDLADGQVIAWQGLDVGVVHTPGPHPRIGVLPAGCGPAQR